MYDKEEKSLIWLDSFHLEYTKKLQIYHLHNSLYSVILNFNEFKHAITKIVGEDIANRMQQSLSSKVYLQQLLESYQVQNLTCLTLKSANYPVELLQIDRPPFVLYCKGNLKLLSNRKFSIVGSRRTLPNILKLTHEFSKSLATVFTIVTGIADGADTQAVEGAMEHKNCIVVLAFGFKYCTPECNKFLLDKVYKEGLVLSEYPPNVAPKSYYYPERNRLLAGLSEGVLIVSAGQKSGTKITANYAYQYGKSLFAFPYSIGISSGIGCNALIQQFATLCTKVLDITEAFGVNINKAIEVVLNEVERQILAIIQNGDTHIMQISAKTGLASFEIAPILTVLELKKLIASCGGNRYIALVEDGTNLE